MSLYFDSILGQNHFRTYTNIQQMLESHSVQPNVAEGDQLRCCVGSDPITG